MGARSTAPARAKVGHPRRGEVYLTVDRQRLIRHLGALRQETMRRVDRALISMNHLMRHESGVTVAGGVSCASWRLDRLSGYPSRRGGE
jgi:hypothetical protein